jgi:alcohol dehydrogenase
MGCAGVTTFNALRSSSARPGDTVAVVGLGGLGHLAVQFAGAMGFTVIAVARSPEKEAAAHELGAAHYIASSATDVGVALRDLGPVSLVYSTAADTLIAQQAATGLRPRGELLLSGIGSDPLALDVGRLVMFGLQVRGHVTGGPTDIQDAMRFAVASGVRAWTDVRSLEDVEAAVEEMRGGRARFRMVLRS